MIPKLLPEFQAWIFIFLLHYDCHRYIDTIFYYVDRVLALTRRGCFMTFISILAIQTS